MKGIRKDALWGLANTPNSMLRGCATTVAHDPRIMRAACAHDARIMCIISDAQSLPGLEALSLSTVSVVL